MRRLPAAALTAGKPMDGEVVADAGMKYMIDNMEGLSVRKTDDGKIIVYLVSDDNFKRTAAADAADDVRVEELKSGSAGVPPALAASLHVQARRESHEERAGRPRSQTRSRRGRRWGGRWAQ